MKNEKLPEAVKWSFIGILTGIALFFSGGISWAYSFETKQVTPELFYWGGMGIVVIGLLIAITAVRKIAK